MRSKRRERSAPLERLEVGRERHAPRATPRRPLRHGPARRSAQPARTRACESRGLCLHDALQPEHRRRGVVLDQQREAEVEREVRVGRLQLDRAAQHRGGAAAAGRVCRNSASAWLLSAAGVSARRPPASRRAPPRLAVVAALEQARPCRKRAARASPGGCTRVQRVEGALVCRARAAAAAPARAAPRRSPARAAARAAASARAGRLGACRPEHVRARAPRAAAGGAAPSAPALRSERARAREGDVPGQVVDELRQPLCLAPEAVNGAESVPRSTSSSRSDSWTSSPRSSRRPTTMRCGAASASAIRIEVARVSDDRRQRRAPAAPAAGRRAGPPARPGTPSACGSRSETASATRARRRRRPARVRRQHQQRHGADAASASSGRRAPAVTRAARSSRGGRTQAWAPNALRSRKPSRS